MRAQCDHCGRKYTFNPDKLKTDRAKVTCQSCGQVFLVIKPGALAVGGGGSPAAQGSLGETAVFSVLDLSQIDGMLEPAEGDFEIDVDSVLDLSQIEDMLPSLDQPAAQEGPGRLEAPMPNPRSGRYVGVQTVAWSHPDPGAVLYYTLDGAEPTEASLVYASPLPVAETLVIKTRAFKPGAPPSKVVTAAYEITGAVADPVLSPPPGLFPGPRKITLSCPTPGSEIRVSTDGNEPTRTFPLYTEPLEIAKTTRLKARAFRPGWTPSAVIDALYDITGQVEPPVFSVPAGTFPMARTVALTTATPEAVIHYTLDGQEPDEKSSRYQDPIAIQRSTTLKARAFRTKWVPSPVAAAEYAITGAVARPQLSLADGAYTSNQSLAITCSTPDTRITYTLDGSDPKEDSLVYSEPIAVTHGVTIHARAYKADWLPSEMAVATFKVTGAVAPPVFDPAPGVFTQPIKIKAGTETPEARIHYTLDGRDPSGTDPVFSTPLALAGGAELTIRLRAFKPDWTPSPVVEGRFQMAGPLGLVTADPPPGAYTEPQLVALSSSQPDVQIRYTFDETDPTPRSPVYHEPFFMGGSAQIRARSFRAGSDPGPVLVAEYRITGMLDAPVLAPPSGLFTRPQNVTMSVDMEEAEIRYTLDGSDPRPDSSLYTEPIQVFASARVTARAFCADWIPSDPVSVDYEITGQAPLPTLNPAPGVYVAPQRVALAGAGPEAVIRFTIDGSEPTEASMTYVAPIDAAAPLMVKARAFRKDWEPSDTVTGFYKITGTVADPGVNPPGGTFTTPPKVTLATSTPEAQVRYTLDGSLPTATSPLYAGSLTVTASSTLTVRAYKDDWAPSRMARAVFIVTGRVAEVAIDPPAGTYQEDFRVTMSTATPDARIHYTLDGSAPNAGSPVYRMPVLVSDSVTLRAAALKPAWDPSPVAEAVYSLTGTAAKPVFSPPSGDLAPDAGVTLTTATPRARIHYTTDGSTPTEQSPVFGPPVRSRKSFILSAKAFRPGWEPSPMAAATYRVSGLVAPVTADPPAMVSARPFTVSLATTTDEAGIRYTLDGSEPTEESQEYTGPVTIDQTALLQARAFFPGWTPSPILKAEYAITGAVAEPKFSVRPGVYASPQRLEITSATPGAQIRYTTDGTDPTPSSDLYTGPIDIGASITLYAQGFKDGWEPSPILAAGYTIIIRPGGKPAPKPATPSPAPKAAEPPAPKAAEPPAPKAAEPPAPKAAEPPAPKVVAEPPAPKVVEPRMSPQVSIVATEEEPEEPFVEIVDEEADDEEWAVDLADIHETRKKRHHDTTLIQAPAPEVPTALPPADWPTLTGPLPDFLYVTNEEWHNAGEEVITEGKYGSWLWVVLEGGVDVFRITPEGEIPILRLGEGCYPGAMASVLSQEHIRTATTRTAGRTCLGVLDMQRIATELVRLSFPFREMMQSLVHRVTQVTDRAVEFYQGKVHTPPEVRAADVVVPQGEGKVPLVRIGKGRAYVVRRVKNEKAYLATLKEGDYFGSIPFMPLGHEPQGAMILGNADLATEKVDAKKFDAEFNRATSILRNIFLSVGRSIEVTTDVAQNYLKKKKPK